MGNQPGAVKMDDHDPGIPASSGQRKSPEARKKCSEDITMPERPGVGATMVSIEPAAEGTVLQGTRRKVAEGAVHKPSVEPAHVKVTSSTVPELRHSAELDRQGEKEAVDTILPYGSVSAGNKADMDRPDVKVEVGAPVPFPEARLEGLREVALDRSYSSSEKLISEYSLQKSSAKGGPFRSCSPRAPDATFFTECNLAVSPLALTTERLQESPSNQTLMARDKDDGHYGPFSANEVIISSETRPMERIQEKIATQQPSSAGARANARQHDFPNLMNSPEEGGDLQNEQSLENTTKCVAIEEINVLGADGVTAFSSPSPPLKGCFKGTHPVQNIVSDKSNDSKPFDGIHIHPETEIVPNVSTTRSSATDSLIFSHLRRSPIQKENLTAVVTPTTTGIVASEVLGVDDVAVRCFDSTSEPYIEGVSSDIPEPPAAAQIRCLEEKYETHETASSNDTSATDTENKDLLDSGGHRHCLTSTTTQNRSPENEKSLSKDAQPRSTPVKHCLPQYPFTLKAAEDNTKEAFAADSACQLLDSASDIAGSQKVLTRSIMPGRASVLETNITGVTSKTLCSLTTPDMERVQDVEGNGNTSGAPVTYNASAFTDDKNVTDSSLNNITILQRGLSLASNESGRNSSNRSDDAGLVNVAAAGTSEDSVGVTRENADKRLEDIEVTQGIQEENEVHRLSEVREGSQQSEDEKAQEAIIAEHEIGDDSDVFFEAEAPSFLQAGGSEPETVGFVSPLSARLAQEADNVGPSRREPAFPAASGAIDKLADNIPENTGAVETAASKTSSEDEVLLRTSCNENNGNGANGTEYARTREGRTTASQSSSVVETKYPLQDAEVISEGVLRATSTTALASDRVSRSEPSSQAVGTGLIQGDTGSHCLVSSNSSQPVLEQELRGPPSREMKIPKGSVGEDVSAPEVGSCEVNTLYRTATPVTKEGSEIIDATSIKSLNKFEKRLHLPNFSVDVRGCSHSPPVAEGAQLYTARVDGGCINPALPPSSENSQWGMDFAGVANESSSSRLNSGRETVLYDENVNTFPSQSTPTERLCSTPGGCAGPLDPNDNTLLVARHGERLTGTDSQTKNEVEQVQRGSFLVQDSSLTEVGDSGQAFLPSRKPGKPQALEARRELRTRSFILKKEPSASEAREHSFAHCGGLHCNQKEGLNFKNEIVPEVPRDSEAGPEVAVFSEDEFRCAFKHIKDPSAFDFLQKVGSNKQLGRSSLGRCSQYLESDFLQGERRKGFGTPIPDRKEGSPRSPLTGEPKITLVPVIDSCSSSSKHPVDTSVPPQSVPVEAQEQMFSEKEMSQALKFQELMFQERLLKKDQEQCEEQKQAKAHFEAQENALCRMYQATKEMARVCEEVGKERQRLQAEVAKVNKERDQLMEDLRGVETAFSDFHRRYEQAKDVIRTMKENETFLRKELAGSHDMLEQRNLMLNTVKTEADESLEMSKKEIEDLRRNKDAEITVLKAQLKRIEMRYGSLERQLEQKTEENTQLTQMYDDLLSKVQQK